MTPAPAALLTRHGLSAERLEEVAGGFVNRVWATPDVVLRVSPSARHAREARVACGALAAGVRTARPLFWGRGYSIWERLPGSPPAALTSALWAELLGDLERLHAHPPVPQPARLPTHWQGEPERVAASQAEAGWTAGERARLTERLSTPSPLSEPVFVHADAYRQNVLADAQSRYVGLIDWGNAGWATLEREVCSLEQMEPALARWGDRLDRALLARLRLDLLLKVAQAGRLPFGLVWEALTDPHL
ncbi:Phosphotransferase enzyme family protein [Deinococcus reticulitermitis]|uniref:Phosphotransferase enzyme family protein n=1 Tax=Deinococcus reticulitermitis TaxID=856736 RepID=A0A1H6ZMU1_9DEIO|nr:aminoglycoside phosphotransferase family protein [Deinococcus reticulitermitis]SEJ54006.1 Phosphotransferase enzyme family protein [Deinococcus reticulitermitis]